MMGPPTLLPSIKVDKDLHFDSALGALILSVQTIGLAIGKLYAGNLADSFGYILTASTKLPDFRFLS